MDFVFAAFGFIFFFVIVNMFTSRLDNIHAQSMRCADAMERLSPPRRPPPPPPPPARKSETSAKRAAADEAWRRAQAGEE
jgi:hypothetical protein